MTPFRSEDLAVSAEKMAIVERNQAAQANMETRNSDDIVIIRVEKQPWRVFKRGKEASLD